MKVSVTVHPNSKTSKVEKNENDHLHIFITESPIEGRANGATIKALSKICNVPKSSIKLLRGVKSRNKIFEIIAK
jgi:uncharacterized protein YggU (UPF0235/DUF167 family)